MQETYVGSPNLTQGRNGVICDRLIIHWMDGLLAAADATFQNTARQTSAHYGVEEGVIHQYVSEEDIAWGAGVWDMNERAIQIEHSAQPGRDASAATYNTSAHLIAEILTRHPSITLDRIHIIKHSEVPYATQCSGTVSPDQLVAQALLLKGQASPPVPVVVAPQPAAQLPVTPWTGKITVTTADLMVRSDPNTNARHGLGNTPDGDLHRGNVADIVGYTHAQMPYASATDIWLSTVNGHWIWSGGTDFSGGTVMTLPAQAAPTVATAGAVTVTAATLNVRTGPGTSYPGNMANTPDGQLHAGNTVQFIAVAQGQSVNGIATWLQSIHGNWFWAGGTNYR